MTRFPAYVLVGLLCASPLMAQSDNTDANSEARKAQVLKKQVAELHAALAAAKDRLTATTAALKQTQEHAAVEQKKAQEYRARAEAAWEEAMEKLNRSKLDQLADMLNSVEKQVGREHAYANSLREQLLVQAGDYAAALEATTQRLGPKHPKVLALQKQLGAVKEAARTAGRERKSGNGERDALQSRAATLTAQLAESRQKFGTNHPRVKQLTGELNSLERRLSVISGSESKLRQQLADRMDALKDLEVQLARSAHKDHFDDYRERVARERAELAAKLKLAEQQRSTALQDRRTQEMLVMQERLANATRLADESVAKVRSSQGATIKALDKRMANVERKLDRIADLLEKMLDK